jgi:hypothetical protein
MVSIQCIRWWTLMFFWPIFRGLLAQNLARLLQRRWVMTVFSFHQRCDALFRYLMHWNHAQMSDTTIVLSDTNWKPNTESISKTWGGKHSFHSFTQVSVIKITWKWPRFKTIFQVTNPWPHRSSVKVTDNITYSKLGELKQQCSHTLSFCAWYLFLMRMNINLQS